MLLFLFQKKFHQFSERDMTLSLQLFGYFLLIVVLLLLLLCLRARRRFDLQTFGGERANYG